MKSSVTISTVKSSKGAHIFQGDLSIYIPKAKQIGFDGIELCVTNADEVDGKYLQRLLDDNNLVLSAVPTGAGKALHNLTLTSPDKAVRAKAIDFIKRMIDFGAPFNAPAKIGSMQGHIGNNSRGDILAELADSLNELGRYAAQRNVELLFEPLSHLSTDVINTLAEGIEIIKKAGADNIKLLADLFHMDIAEKNIAESIKQAAGYIGYVDFVDSDRKPAGTGHIDLKSAVDALKYIGYKGYLSAEALPWPDSQTAAEQSIKTFKSLCA
ncbi:MAG: sugar phosphate isomerase/epimerase family protein [Phycisphaerae bacterium]